MKIDLIASYFVYLGCSSTTRGFVPSTPTSFLVSQGLNINKDIIKNDISRERGWFNLRMTNDETEDVEKPQNDTVNAQKDKIDNFKSNMNIYEDRPSTYVASKPTSVVMKFGGSSLASADRINEVSYLIKSQIELGYQPRAIVCSAMGKTTNTLLNAGEFALGKLVILIFI